MLLSRAKVYDSRRGCGLCNPQKSRGGDQRIFFQVHRSEFVWYVYVMPETARGYHTTMITCADHNRDILQELEDLAREEVETCEQWIAYINSRGGKL